jgi:hypothetical protein
MEMRIGLSYTSQADSTVYTLLFSQFTGEDLPRSYVGNASFSTSANGTTVLGGPAYRQKYIWGISAFVTPSEALTLDAMYRAWDLDRSTGAGVACGVTDELFGASLTTSAVFSTPPSYVRLSPSTWTVDFGLSEV